MDQQQSSDITTQTADAYRQPPDTSIANHKFLDNVHLQNSIPYADPKPAIYTNEILDNSPHHITLSQLKNFIQTLINFSTNAMICSCILPMTSLTS